MEAALFYFWVSCVAFSLVLFAADVLIVVSKDLQNIKRFRAACRSFATYEGMIWHKDAEKIVGDRIEHLLDAKDVVYDLLRNTGVDFHALHEEGLRKITTTTSSDGTVKFCQPDGYKPAKHLRHLLDKHISPLWYIRYKIGQIMPHHPQPPRPIGGMKGANDGREKS